MIKNKVVGGYKKIEDTVVGGYKKMEENVVGVFHRVEDNFKDSYLTNDKETVKEAKEKLQAEQKARIETSKV